MTEEIQYKLLKILGENPAITQRELAAMPVPRAWHSLTRLSDGRLLILGGQHRSDFVGGGLLYD